MGELKLKCAKTVMQKLMKNSDGSTTVEELPVDSTGKVDKSQLNSMGGGGSGQGSG